MPKTAKAENPFYGKFDELVKAVVNTPPSRERQNKPGKTEISFAIVPSKIEKKKRRKKL